MAEGLEDRAPPPNDDREVFVEIFDRPNRLVESLLREDLIYLPERPGKDFLIDRYLIKVKFCPKAPRSYPRVLLTWF